MVVKCVQFYIKKTGTGVLVSETPSMVTRCEQMKDRSDFRSWIISSTKVQSSDVDVHRGSHVEFLLIIRPEISILEVFSVIIYLITVLHYLGLPEQSVTWFLFIFFCCIKKSLGNTDFLVFVAWLLVV